MPDAECTIKTFNLHRHKEKPIGSRPQIRQNAGSNISFYCLDSCFPECLTLKGAFPFSRDSCLGTGGQIPGVSFVYVINTLIELLKLDQFIL